MVLPVGYYTAAQSQKAVTVTTTTTRTGGGPRVVISTAAFHARFRGSVPGLGGLKETKWFLPHPRVKVSIVGSLRDREVACSASDRQGSNFESCVWRTVSSQSSHHPQEVLLAQFSLYVHKGGLKPDSFHFISLLGHVSHYPHAIIVSPFLVLTLTTLKYFFCLNYGDQRFFFQFQIIINVLVSPSRFICIPMLWVYSY